MYFKKMDLRVSDSVRPFEGVINKCWMRNGRKILTIFSGDHSHWIIYPIIQLTNEF